jgi:hypothetical protein
MAKKGMEAVLEKTSAAAKGRKPALKRKGPGIAIMIAVGKPKPGMEKGEKGAPMADEKPKGKLAALEARIAELEAQLAAMEGEESDEEEDA